MSDDSKGTWDEVIKRNEQEDRELELRVVRSKYRELHLWKGESSFLLGKGTAASTERWYLYTPLGEHYGDSMDEVLRAAERDYSAIRSWASEWNSR